MHLKPIQTTKEATIIYILQWTAWWDHKCLEYLTVEQMCVAIKETIALMKNFVFAGTNLLLSSHLHGTHNQMMVQELSPSCSSSTRLKWKRPCMIGCNTSDWCTLASLRRQSTGEHASIRLSSSSKSPSRHKPGEANLAKPSCLQANSKCLRSSTPRTDSRPSRATSPKDNGLTWQISRRSLLVTITCRS